MIGLSFDALGTQGLNAVLQCHVMRKEAAARFDRANKEFSSSSFFHYAKGLGDSKEISSLDLLTWLHRRSNSVKGLTPHRPPPLLRPETPSTMSLQLSIKFRPQFLLLRSKEVMEPTLKAYQVNTRIPPNSTSGTKHCWKQERETL